MAAETAYAYDGSSLVSASGFPGHDDPNYGTSYTNRGNATGKSEYINASSTLSWSYTYDQTGQRMSMTEPNNATTSYTYENENTYLDQVTYPSTNGVAHIVSFTYNFPSGELATSTDENSQVTSYSYNDPLLRLTEVSYPDTGQTTYGYTSICAHPSSTSILLQGSTSYAETATPDGLCQVTMETVTQIPKAKATRRRLTTAGAWS
jgi:YD repeat-containing protein